MPTQAAINVTASGSSPVATVTQTQNSATVNLQQMVIADSTGTGTAGIFAPVDANGLHVVLSTGTQKTSGVVTQSAIAAGGNATCTSSTDVTNAKTGTLQHAIFASTQDTQWDLQTVNNAGSPTTVATFYTSALETFDFKPGSPTEISTVASTGTATFQVVATNLSTNGSQTATANATFFWAEN